MPTLFLDADLDPEIVRRWWPTLRDGDEVEDITCGWSEHVRVVHVRGCSFSKSWAMGYGSDATVTRRAAKHRRDLDRFIRWGMAATGATAGETMVVGYKALIEAMGDETGDGLYAVAEDPEDWSAAGWFNALAGIDRWRDVRVGFVVGRPQADVREIGDLGRAVWGHEDRDWSDVEPDGSGFLKMPKERFRLPTRDGGIPSTVYADVHPDARADRIHRQITWGQPMQADGRIRPVYRTADRPCTLFVMGDIPRGMAVDDVVWWQDVIPSRFDMAVAKAIGAGGVVPVTAGALAAFAPELWKTKEAVKDDCRILEDGETVEDMISRAVERAVFFGKGGQHAIRLSYSVLPPLNSEIDEIAIDGDCGEARNEGQRGSPFRWVRIPNKTDTTLSAGLVAAFGPSVGKVRIGEDGAWLTLPELRDLEDRARQHLERLHRRHEMAALEWFRLGVVPPDPEDMPPATLSPRSKFRRDVATRREDRARRLNNPAIVYREAGAAMIWGTNTSTVEAA